MLLHAVSRSFALLAALCIAAMSTAFLRADDAAPDDVAKYGRKLNDEERLAALDLMVKEMKANYEKIRTWNGEYHFIVGNRDFRNDPSKSEYLPPPPGSPPKLNQGDIAIGEDAGGGHWKFSCGKLAFALAPPQGKYHAFIHANEPDCYLDVATGFEGFATRANRPQRLVKDYVVTPEAGFIYHVTSSFPQIPGFPDVESVTRQGGRGRLFERRKPDEMSDGDYVDLPGFFYSCNFPPWKICEFTAAALRGERGEKIREMSKVGYAMYVNNESPPTYTEVNRYPNHESVRVYDGNAAFYIVKLRDVTEKLRSEQTIEYRRAGGIFIPETFKHATHELKDGDFLPVRNVLYELLSTKINGDIPETEFGLEQFDLKYGERMLDRKEKKLFVYNDELGFVPAEDFRFDPNRVKNE